MSPSSMKPDRERLTAGSAEPPGSAGETGSAEGPAGSELIGSRAGEASHSSGAPGGTAGPVPLDAAAAVSGGESPGASRDAPSGNAEARFLSTDHLAKNLRRRSVRGGAAALIGQGGTFLINLGGTAILARLLTPRDSGLLAMVATFTRLIDQLKDMGLATATIQRRELTPAQVSYLFWVNVLVGGLASLVALAAAPFIAWFYHEPTLTGITLALSTGFLIAGLGVQHQALLNRQMYLRSLAVNKIVGVLAGTLAGIALAALGARYWALVGVNLATALVSTLGLWWVCPWRPKAPKRHVEGTSSLMAFGWRVTGTRMLTFITRNLDNILIGKVWGDVALGYYARAYQILMLPVQQLINPLTNVVVPALSRLQNDQAAYIRYYQRCLRTLTTLTMPLVAICFVAADELIAVMLGPRWAASAPIFKWLAPAAFAGSFNPVGWAWVSLNQTDRMLRWTLIATPINALGFVLGVPFGVTGVAAAFSITQLVLRYFSVSYCFKTNFLTFGVLIEATWQATTASLGALAIVFGIFWFFPVHGLPIFLLLLKGVVYACCYLAIWWCLPGGRAALSETVALVHDLRAARPKAGSKPGAAQVE